MPDPLHPDTRRRLWRITLSTQWIQLLGHLGLYYDPRPLARLNHGVSQAVARLCLSHSLAKWPRGGFRIDTVLGQLGVSRSMAVRDARRRLQADRHQMLVMGLDVSDGRINLVDDGS